MTDSDREISLLNGAKGERKTERANRVSANTALYLVTDGQQLITGDQLSVLDYPQSIVKIEHKRVETNKDRTIC